MRSTFNIKINKRIIKKFLLIVGGVAGTYLLIASVVTISLLAANSRQHWDPTPPVSVFSEEAAENEDTANLPHIDELGELPPLGTERINVLILGMDNAARLTDTIIVASFDPTTGAVHLLNIPRDTLLIIPQSRMDCMRSNGLNPWNSNVRINAMRSLGRQFGAHYLQEQLAEDLGIEFHHFVEIDLAAFRRVVDLAGGVEMEIPIRMSHDMRDQGSHEILIDIQPGLQHLDGAAAEQVIRFRNYAAADIARISVQQQFMTQLFRQVLRRDTIMSDPLGFVGVAIDYVETDVSLTDALRYLPYLEMLSPERIFTHTLPGHSRRLQGGEFWVPNAEEMPALINKIFFDSLEEEEEVTDRPSHGLDIAILNGGIISGRAMDFADRLSMDGYTITHTDTYTGTRQNRTRILVREEGMGEDLLEYFSDNAAILVEPNQEWDITIIIGRSEG